MKLLGQPPARKIRLLTFTRAASAELAQKVTEHPDLGCGSPEHDQTRAARCCEAGALSAETSRSGRNVGEAMARASTTSIHRPPARMNLVPAVELIRNSNVIGNPRSYSYRRYEQCAN
jgi:hypothetical protein